MADNVEVDSGTGIPVATDDVGGQHYQKVKIGDGTADSSTMLKVVAEDAQHTSGDTGLVTMSVRQDTAAALAGTDADYQPLITDSSGRLHVNVGNTVTVGSHAVTNAGTFAVQVDGSALTALQLIDNTIFVDDAAFTPATSSVNAAGLLFDDVAPDSVDEGDIGIARMSANRNAYTTIRDAAGNERGVNVNASNQLAIAGPVTNAGTFAVQVDGAALTSLQLIDDTVFTDDAAFTPGTSKGLAVGFQVDDTGTDSVDEGDFGVARMSANRVQYAQLRDAAGNERGANVTAGNRLTVDAAVASGGIASGAVASGAIASGAVASGAFASGSIASGAIAAGAIAAGATSIAENEDVASADGDRGVKVLFKRLDTPANSSGTDGDYEQPQMSAGRIWASATVTSVVPGTTATSLGKAIDTATGATDTGVLALATRDDALSTLTPAEGDNVQLRTDSVGALWVRATGAAGGTSAVDDAAFTAATDSGTPIMGFVTADAVDSGDAGVVGMTTDRKLTVQASVASGGIASGAVASGAIASGAIASGAVASGAFASGSIASGAIAAGAIAAGATSIADNEDVASADGDRGVKILVRRTDTPANTSGTDGDYEFLQVSGGFLWTSARPVGVFTCSTDVTRPADTTAYAVNDAISDSTSAPTSGGFTFTSAARASGGSGVITGFTFASSNDAATSLQGEVWIFDQSVTNINDNSAFAVSDTEIKTCICKIPFAAEDSGNNQFANVQNLYIPFTASGSANLRFLIRAKNAYTPASAEVLTFVIRGFYTT